MPLVTFAMAADETVYLAPLAMVIPSTVEAGVPGVVIVVPLARVADCRVLDVSANAPATDTVWVPPERVRVALLVTVRFSAHVTLWTVTLVPLSMIVWFTPAVPTSGMSTSSPAPGNRLASVVWSCQLLTSAVQLAPEAAIHFTVAGTVRSSNCSSWRRGLRRRRGEALFGDSRRANWRSHAG